MNAATPASNTWARPSPAIGRPPAVSGSAATRAAYEIRHQPPKRARPTLLGEFLPAPQTSFSPAKNDARRRPAWRHDHKSAGTSARARERPPRRSKRSCRETQFPETSTHAPASEGSDEAAPNTWWSGQGEPRASGSPWFLGPHQPPDGHPVDDTVVQDCGGPAGLAPVATPRTSPQPPRSPASCPKPGCACRVSPWRSAQGTWRSGLPRSRLLAPPGPTSQARVSARLRREVLIAPL